MTKGRPNEAQAEIEAGKIVCYTDAAVSNEGTAMVAVNDKRELAHMKLRESINPREVELKAVRMAIKNAEPPRECGLHRL